MEAVGDFIRDSLWSLDVSCVVGDFPSLKSQGISVSLLEGESSIRFLGTKSCIRIPYVTITVRSSTYSDGQRWLKECREILDSLSDSSVLAIMMVDSPSHRGRDDLKMHEFQVIYKILIEE